MIFILAVVDPDPQGVKVGRLIQDTLAEVHMSQKHARLLMEFRTDSQFTQQLQGYGHISIARLLRLPWEFWARFLPKLAALVVSELCATKAERLDQ